jgi:hypothetical protein
VTLCLQQRDLSGLSLCNAHHGRSQNLDEAGCLLHGDALEVLLESTASCINDGLEGFPEAKLTDMTAARRLPVPTTAKGAQCL